MSGGGTGKGGGGNEAAQARNDEADRQKNIRAGMAGINGIFDGGGTGQLGAGASIDPNATYYDANGLAFDPSGRMKKLGSGQGGAADMFGVSSGGDPNDPALRTRALQQAAGEGQLYSGKGGGFDDAFYKGRRDAYTSYANPQLQDQYANAGKELTFALARSGNLDSSARAQKEGERTKLYGQRSREIGDQALQQETTARNSVEDARSNLVTMLNATGDVNAAVNGATARSQALSQQPAFSPIGQLFSDFTAGLGTQAAAERATALSGGTYKSPYNTGLFGVGGATKVTP